jgi:hypothetical protein
MSPSGAVGFLLQELSANVRFFVTLRKTSISDGVVLTDPREHRMLQRLLLESYEFEVEKPEGTVGAICVKCSVVRQKARIEPS